MKILGHTKESDNHGADIECLLYNDGELFSGADDGNVKVWSDDLTLKGEFKAHDYAIYDLTMDKENKRLYTCSADFKIRKWKNEDGKWVHEKTLESHEDSVRKLVFVGGTLYSGDEKGEVKIWTNDSVVGSCNMSEEIWDLKILGRIIITVRDRDVVFNELNESTSRWWTKKTIQGRAPIYISENNKICFPDRNGMSIQLFQASGDFPELGKLQGHTMIINAMVGTGNKLYSGGWDKVIIAWDIDKLTQVDQQEVNTTVTTMAINSTGGKIFVAGGTGIQVLEDS